VLTPEYPEYPKKRKKKGDEQSLCSKQQARWS
jgi:hypothetical protein